MRGGAQQTMQCICAICNGMADPPHPPITCPSPYVTPTTEFGRFTFKCVNLENPQTEECWGSDVGTGGVADPKNHALPLRVLPCQLSNVIKVTVT